MLHTQTPLWLASPAESCSPASTRAYAYYRHSLSTVVLEFLLVNVVSEVSLVKTPFSITSKTVLL